MRLRFAHRLVSPLEMLGSSLWGQNRRGPAVSVCAPSPRWPPTFRSGAACGLGGFASSAPQILPSRE